MLESDDGVVRIAHDNHVAPGTSLPPLVDPQIVDVVEIDIGQERADDSALWRSLLGHDQAAVSHFAINLMIRRSPIRCSTKRISQDWLTLSKKDWTSQSSTQLMRRLPIPHASASSAWC